MLKYNYNKYFCEDMADLIKGDFAPDENEGTELIWQKLSNGDYVLSSKKNNVSEYFTHAGKLERSKQTN